MTDTLETPIDHLYDEVLVQAIIDRRRDTDDSVTRLDRIEIVRRMAALGCSDGQIACRLNCTKRTVIRIRKAHGFPPGPPRWGARSETDYPTLPWRSH